MIAEFKMAGMARPTNITRGVESHPTREGN
jgi:hypothetical protein